MFAHDSRNRQSVLPVILTINLAVFLAWNLPGFVSPEFMVKNFLVSWAFLSEGRVWTLLTSAFSHNALWHGFVNMYVLYGFGRLIEMVLGSSRFLKFYLVAAIISSFCHASVSAFLLDEPALPALGASGAVSAVLIVFSLLFPREKILILGLIPAPAALAAIAFVSLDIWGLLSQLGGGGLPIGHGAHLGGAITGAIYFIFFLRPRRRRYSRR